MKLTTLLVAATFAIPAAAFADSSQPNSAPGKDAPATHMNMKKQGTTTGSGAADSSIPGATNPNTSNAPAKRGTTGAPAGDSSLPGASKK